LNFVIFYVGKSAESWTLLFLLAKKVRKVGLLSFLLAESLTLSFLMVEKDAESWTCHF
jgi:hypothetical protein